MSAAGKDGSAQGACTACIGGATARALGERSMTLRRSARGAATPTGATFETAARSCLACREESAPPSSMISRTI